MEKFKLVVSQNYEFEKPVVKIDNTSGIFGQSVFRGKNNRRQKLSATLAARVFHKTKKLDRRPSKETSVTRT